MTLEQLEKILTRHRFRATSLAPKRCVWTRGPRHGRRFIATLSPDGWLDVTAPRLRRPVGARTCIHEHTVESLDAWVLDVIRT